jgi:hypothetical protein
MTPVASQLGSGTSSGTNPLILSDLSGVGPEPHVLLFKREKDYQIKYGSIMKRADDGIVQHPRLF